MYHPLLVAKTISSVHFPPLQFPFLVSCFLLPEIVFGTPTCFLPVPVSSKSCHPHFASSKEKSLNSCDFFFGLQVVPLLLHQMLKGVKRNVIKNILLHLNDQTFAVDRTWQNHSKIIHPGIMNTNVTEERNMTSDPIIGFYQQ